MITWNNYKNIFGFIFLSALVTILLFFAVINEYPIKNDYNFSLYYTAEHNEASQYNEIWLENIVVDGVPSRFMRKFPEANDLTVSRQPGRCRLMRPGVLCSDMPCCPIAYPRHAASGRRPA